MSHQEYLHDTPSGEHINAVLDDLVSESVFQDLQFQDDASWSPRSLVFAALLWAWSGKSTLTKRFVEALKLVLRFVPCKKTPGKSYQGFVKRLRYWSDELLLRLKTEFQRRMLADLPAYCLIAGWLVLAGDGSRCATPRTKSNEGRFAGSKKAKRQQKKGKGPTKKRRKQLQAQKRRRCKKQAESDRQKKAQTPQIWLTVLYVVGVGLPWDWRIGPSDSSEREHLAEMAGALPSNTLLTTDAGFVGYEYWKTLHDQGITFVGRIGANVNLLRNLGYVKRKKDIVYVWPQKQMRKQQPPLVLRLTCFTGGKEMVYLVTNELDKRRLSNRDLREIYAARWGIEVYYRDLKQTFGRSKLRSKSADNAELEMNWSIIGLWAMALYTSLHHQSLSIAPHRRSIAQMLDAFQEPMTTHKSAPDEGEDLWSKLSAALKDEYERKSSKASRNHPRKKKKHKIGEPAIVDATVEQIELAQEIKTNEQPAPQGLTA